MPWFEHNGYKLVYSEFGEGPRPCVLLHGIFMNRRMHEPLARALAERGNRVITLDLLGHGESDCPPHMSRYSMQRYGVEVIALLDHLGIDKAVVGGTSLGANVALEVATSDPQRVRGMVLEMPVLENALLPCAVFFTPPMIGFVAGARLLRGLGKVVRAIPSELLPLWSDISLDILRRDPAANAAVVRGLFFGRTAPPRHARRSLDAPGLVIGHPRDPLHPFSDAGMLADELPNGQRLDASSIFEMRMRPDRLTAAIADFVDDCWAVPARPDRKRAAA